MVGNTIFNWKKYYPMILTNNFHIALLDREAVLLKMWEVVGDMKRFLKHIRTRNILDMKK